MNALNNIQSPSTASVQAGGTGAGVGEGERNTTISPIQSPPTPSIPSSTNWRDSIIQKHLTPNELSTTIHHKSSTNTNRSSSKSISLLLFYASWNHQIDAARCLEFLECIFSSVLEATGVDLSDTTVRIYAVEVDGEGEDGEDLCVERYAVPAELPALRVMYNEYGYHRSSSSSPPPPSEQTTTTGGETIKTMEFDVDAKSGEVLGYLSVKKAETSMFSFAQAAFEEGQERVGIRIRQALEKCILQEQAPTPTPPTPSMTILPYSGEENNIGIDGNTSRMITDSTMGGYTHHQHTSPPSSSFSSSSPNNNNITTHTHIQNQNTTTTTTTLEEGPIRIFIAGDSTQVGKSSVCLGLLGTLLHDLHYSPSQLAYIKPATQCEEVGLVTQYCRRYGVPTVQSSPLVYYTGFTRAFLNGSVGVGSDELLSDIAGAVDRLAMGGGGSVGGGGVGGGERKKVMIIDGVGYPAVGSITGTDNADVALACGYPLSSTVGVGGVVAGRQPPGVVLVGKSGVGNAIDSYNLNATYFKAKKVPVMGVIFNKMQKDGYYALEECRVPITKYFAQRNEATQRQNALMQQPHGQQQQQRQQREEKVFGFVPMVDTLNSNIDNSVDQFVRTFAASVDVRAILESAAIIKANTSSSPSLSNHHQQKATTTANYVPPTTYIDTTFHNLNGTLNTITAPTPGIIHTAEAAERLTTTTSSRSNHRPPTEHIYTPTRMSSSSSSLSGAVMSSALNHTPALSFTSNQSSLGNGGAGAGSDVVRIKTREEIERCAGAGSDVVRIKTREEIERLAKEQAGGGGGGGG